MPEIVEKFFYGTSITQTEFEEIMLWLDTFNHCLGEEIAKGMARSHPRLASIMLQRKRIKDENNS